MVIISAPSKRASAFLIDNLLKETVAESKAVCSPPTSPPVHPAFRDSKQTTVVTLQSACVEKELQSESDSSSACSSPETTREVEKGADGLKIRKKKNRTSFTNYQLQQLELTYRQQRYLPADERTRLSRRLKLADQQVKTWFQNRRMKEKRQVQDSDVTSGAHLATSIPAHAVPPYGFNPSLLSPLAVPYSGLPMSNAVPPSSSTPYGHFSVSQPLAVCLSPVGGSGYSYTNGSQAGFQISSTNNSGLLMARY